MLFVSHNDLLYFIFQTVIKRRRFLVQLRVVLTQQQSSLLIKFSSWLIYLKKPTKWCCRCCSINFLVSRKSVWFQIVMILLSLNLLRNYKVVQPKKLSKDSKLHQLTPWKLRSLRNKSIAGAFFVLSATPILSIVSKFHSFIQIFSDVKLNVLINHAKALHSA